MNTRPFNMQFEVGKKYFMRSPSCYDSVWTYTVVRRTNKTIAISDGETVKTCRVRVWSDGIEVCSPLGRYSMSPILSADRVTQ